MTVIIFDRSPKSTS